MLVSAKKINRDADKFIISNWISSNEPIRKKCEVAAKMAKKTFGISEKWATAEKILQESSFIRIATNLDKLHPEFVEILKGCFRSNIFCGSQFSTSDSKKNKLRRNRSDTKDRFHNCVSWRVRKKTSFKMP